MASHTSGEGGEDVDSELAPTSPDLSLEDLRAEAVHRYHESRRLARMAVAEAWRAGKLLGGVKARTPHGQWRPWLKAEGISKDIAHRYIRLSTLEMSQIATFATVTEALQALSAPRREAAPESVPGQPDAPHVGQSTQAEASTEPAGGEREKPQEKPMAYIYLGTMPETLGDVETDQPSGDSSEAQEETGLQEAGTEEPIDEKPGPSAGGRLRQGIAEGLRSVGEGLEELADRIDLKD